MMVFTDNGNFSSSFMRLIIPIFEFLPFYRAQEPLYMLKRFNDKRVPLLFYGNGSIISLLKILLVLGF
jgi:hypothetical protein